MTAARLKDSRLGSHGVASVFRHDLLMSVSAISSVRATNGWRRSWCTSGPHLRASTLARSRKVVGRGTDG
ncbi:hypothetical protein KCP71_00980 [Salmonella enterica subsp. enterica]|nr:hypothetical protein KCP71_00980 [Salmonella enterica subsp. enterica]